MDGGRDILHASAVAVQGRGCLIMGAAGTGKSTLALEMIAAGAVLVADDRTVLTAVGGEVTMAPPETLAGLIEARGIGIMRLPHGPAPLRLVVDLDRVEIARIPPSRYRHLLGAPRPVILGRGRIGLAALLRLVLLHGIEGPERRDPENRARG